MKSKILAINGTKIKKGTVAHIRLKISEYFTSYPAYIPVIVIRGVKPGPRFFITAAIHGDELNGVEIIRRIIMKITPETLRGTLICVPVVNIFGFYNSSRLLPDRRDLNEHFPGLRNGSSASRIAHKLFNEVIKKCSYGIDIHSENILNGSVPYVIGDMDNKEVKKIAKDLGMKIAINFAGREKSLLRETGKEGISTVLLKIGYIKKFEDKLIQSGLNAVMNVLKRLDMLEDGIHEKSPVYPVFIREQLKIYTNKGGILNLSVQAGNIIQKGDEVGSVISPFGRAIEKIISPEEGFVLGTVVNPLVNPGTIVCRLAKIPPETDMNNLVVT